MLPPLTADGTLPPGVHPAQLEEIVGRFGGGNPTRDECGRRVRHIIEMAKGTGHLKRAFVWGSFVTAKPEPADVDLFLVMSADFRSEHSSPLVRRVFDGEAAQRLLGATVLWTRADVPGGLLNSFLEQWQIDRGGRWRRHGQAPLRPD